MASRTGAVRQRPIRLALLRSKAAATDRRASAAGRGAGAAVSFAGRLAGFAVLLAGVPLPGVVFRALFSAPDLLRAMDRLPVSAGSI
jgi:hypothetical protein